MENNYIMRMRKKIIITWSVIALLIVFYFVWRYFAYEYYMDKVDASSCTSGSYIISPEQAHLVDNSTNN